MKARSSSCLSFFLAVLGSIAAVAEEGSTARVILYSGNHYTGERIELKPGDQIDDFRFQRFPSGRNANNRVSSIRIEGDAQVTIYEYRKFEGDHLTLETSSPRLERIGLADGDEDWGNNLSSIIVRELPPGRDWGRPRGDRGEDRDRDRDRDNRWDRNRDPRDEHRDDDRHVDWNDRRDRDDRHDHADRSDRDDRDHRYDRDDRDRPDVDRDRGWERDRADRERRHRQTEIIVRRAYQDILGREADPQGLQTYVGIMEDRGWDETRLRLEFTRSTEYRTLTVPREIGEIYREVLGREPDPAGLRFYTDRVVRAKWTFSRVKDALMKSPEYRAKQSRR